MLYHGSTHLIEDHLEPRNNYDGNSYVFATSDYAYALIRSGSFDLNKFLVREDYRGCNKPYQLVEIVPGAFEELFNRSGYIYILDDADFVATDDENEFVSKNKIKIKAKITIKCIMDEINRHQDRYELIHYEESEEFWKTVKGGKNGYLERKKKRAQELQKPV